MQNSLDADSKSRSYERMRDEPEAWVEQGPGDGATAPPTLPKEQFAPEAVNAPGAEGEASAHAGAADALNMEEGRVPTQPPGEAPAGATKASGRHKAATIFPGAPSVEEQKAHAEKVSAAEALLRNRPGPLDPQRYMTKGFLSNCATFAIMLVGIAMRNAQFDSARWVLAVGVFGFAGGITNWLAVKMLFDRVPGLYGSGVIPVRFKEIREVVKDTMLRTFFDKEYLERYLKGKLHALAESPGLAKQLERVLTSPEVEMVIDDQLEALKAKPEGLILAMQGIEPRTLKPLVVTFVRGAAAELGPILVKSFDMSAALPIDMLRGEIDALMSAKLLELTPDRVKELMEEVIRVHLGWLIVWGNVFGGLIGLASTAAGYP